MPVGAFVPSRIHLDYPEWQAPLIGNIGQVWAYDGTGYAPVALDFDPAGTAAAAVAAHVGLSNPHSQYYLASGVSGFGATLASAVDAAAARTALALGTIATATETAYLLADGSRAGATSSRQAFTSGITTGSIRPSADGSASIQFQSAAGTTLATVNSTANRWIFDRSEVQYDTGIVNVTMRPTLATGYSTAFSAQLYYGTSISYGGNIDSANAAFRSDVIFATGNVAWAAGWRTYIDIRNTAVVGNVASILIPDVNSVAAGATLLNVFGVYVASQTKGVNKYAIYTNAGDIRLMSSNSDKIGFHGVTPVARQLLATGTGATVDNVITALQNIGLLRQS